MSESIATRLSKVPDKLTDTEIRAVFLALLADITMLRAQMIAHTHGGVTVGAGTTGALNSTAPAALTTTA
jgi:hypothetical protein